jgi:hypothetical protein
MLVAGIAVCHQRPGRSKGERLLRFENEKDIQQFLEGVKFEAADGGEVT